MLMNPLHARFLLLLPRIEAHANIYCRDIRCAADRADFIAETIALAWKWFARLDQRGKDAADFVTTFAAFAVRAVRCGRRVAGMTKAKDGMNRQTQRFLRSAWSACRQRIPWKGLDASPGMPSPSTFCQAGRFAIYKNLVVCKHRRMLGVFDAKLNLLVRFESLRQAVKRHLEVWHRMALDPGFTTPNHPSPHYLPDHLG